MAQTTNPAAPAAEDDLLGESATPPATDAGGHPPFMTPVDHAAAAGELDPSDSAERWNRLALVLVTEEVLPQLVNDRNRDAVLSVRKPMHDATLKLLELSATRVGATADEASKFAAERSAALAPLVDAPELKGTDAVLFVSRAVAAAFNRAADVALGNNDVGKGYVVA